MSTDLAVTAESLAVAAWRELSPGSVEPGAVEMVKDAGFPDKGSVHRLCGVGPGGANVVAKRTHMGHATIESGVYERVLPELGLRAAAYYGSVPDADTKFCWLFMEEVLGEPVSTEHRALVTRWLAELHTAAATLPEPAGLPSKRLEYYLEIVRVSLKQIGESLSRHALDSRQRDVLNRAHHELERVEASWADLAERCAGVPETLMHGDFVAKNLILDTAGRIVAIDWASAGWGPPVTDLRDVDAPIYHHGVSARWPDFTVSAIERAATAGHVLEQIARLRRVTAGLPAPASIRRLRHRTPKLADAVQAAGLRSDGLSARRVHRPPDDRSPLGALAEKLAIDAWTQVQPDLPRPTAIETVKDLGFPVRTAVYRLCGAGPGGADVVAKRCRKRKAVVEGAVYEDLLPSIGLRAATCYGTVEERGTRHCWLFLEFVEGEPFSRRREDHRALVDEFLARLHVGGMDLPRSPRLPSKGPSHFLEVLQRMRKRIEELLAEGALGDAARTALTNAVPQLELVEDRWPDVVELCSGVPETLMHGDFGDKNLVLDREGALVPLDWASAGWGVPAIDLVRVDVERYHALASPGSSGLTVGAVERAASAGSLFRQVSAMRSATRDLNRPSLVEKFEGHRQGLTELLGKVGWG